MMASFGSCGLPGVLHYCLLPLIKYLVSQLLAAQQRLDHTGSAGQDRGKKVEEKKKEWGKGEWAMWKQLFCLLFLLSCFVFCSVSCIYYFQYHGGFHNLLCVSVQQPKFETGHILRESEYGWGSCSLSPSPKRVFFPEKFVQIADQKDEILPRLRLGNVSRRPVNCQHCECTACLRVSSSHLGFS